MPEFVIYYSKKFSLHFCHTQKHNCNRMPYFFSLLPSIQSAHIPFLALCKFFSVVSVFGIFTNPEVSIYI